ncbi:unnamed protein product [Heterobilharzia americana]|nr:unnamed protein product [Heterobilharzia americana]
MFKGHSAAVLTNHLTFGSYFWYDIAIPFINGVKLFSLLFDGITGGVQEHLKRHNVGPYSLMMCMNAWSVTYLLLAIMVNGEAFPFLEFVNRHPYVLSDMAIFSVLSAIGQIFLFGLITNFSALTCSVVTTTRKFFTVLFSIILFDHIMTSRQWIGTILVFSGLILDQIYGKTHSKQSSKSSNTNGIVKPTTRYNKSEEIKNG